MATIKETLEACQIVVNALAVGQGDLSYHPANMVELSNHIAVALVDVSRLTPLAVDGALVTVNEAGEITCKVCGRGMRAKTPRH
jgi:hypothetical protein